MEKWLVLYNSLLADPVSGRETNCARQIKVFAVVGTAVAKLPLQTVLSIFVTCLNSTCAIGNLVRIVSFLKQRRFHLLSLSSIAAYSFVS